MTTEQITVIGPLWSHWGFKYWTLCLEDDVIVAFPYTLIETMLVSYKLQTGHNYFEPSKKLTKLRQRGINIKNLHTRHGIRRYPLDQIRQINMISSYMQNRFCIQTASRKQHVYYIPKRQETDFYRRLLRNRYTEVYRETNFPTSRLGRFLKS